MLLVIAASLVCILSTSVRFAVFVYCGSLKSTGSYWDGYSSGKSLSETSSEDSSKHERSSNSTPRTILPRYSLIKSLVEGLFRLGATTAQGPSMKPFFEFNHYAIGGVMGHKHCLCLCPPLRLRGRTGVFRRREVYLLATLLWVSPSTSSSEMVRHVYKAILMPRCAACGSGAERVCFPFFLIYLFLLSFAYARRVTSSGALGRVSRLRRRSTTAIAHRTSSLLCTVSAKSMCTGVAGRAFPAATACDVTVVFGLMSAQLGFCAG